MTKEKWLKRILEAHQIPQYTSAEFQKIADKLVGAPVQTITLAGPHCSHGETKFAIVYSTLRGKEQLTVERCIWCDMQTKMVMA